VSQQITLASTSDSQAEVETALEAVEGDHVVSPEDVSYESPVTEEKVGRGGVASTTDDPKAVEEIARDMEEQREGRAEEYVGKTRRKLQQTAARLNAERYELKDKLAHSEDELQKTRQENEELKRSQQPPGETPTQPTQSQINPELQFEQIRQQTQQRIHEVSERWPELIRAAQEKYEDYEQVVENCNRNFPYPRIAEIHTNLQENATDIAYYLASRPEIAARFYRYAAAGDAGAILNEIDKISYKLEHDEAPVRRRPAYRRAPEPIEPVRSTGGGRYSKDPDKMNMREYNEWRNNGGGK